MIDLEFQAVRSIYSLPQWHGARWSAWLRNVARYAGTRLEDFVEAIYPFRHGTAPVRTGDILTLRLLITEAGLLLLSGLLTWLSHPKDTGEFSALSLRLVRAVDAVSRRIVWREGAPTGLLPIQFDSACIEDEVSRMLDLREWSIQFLAPLRLPSLQGQRDTSTDRGRYIQPRQLATLAGLHHLLSRVRDFQPVICPVPELTLLDCSLHWEDMRYNAHRQIALGGITGWMGWQGYLDHNQALRLVLGQYLGAGKNGRFGLGFWCVPELGQVRSVSLYNII